MSDPIDDDGMEHREEARFPMEVPVSTRERGAHQMPATLLDLSCGGCRIAAVLPRSPENEIFVRIPGLESLSARVRWNLGSTAGLAFERPLHPAVFQRITSLHRRSPADLNDNGHLPPAEPVAPRRERPAGSRRDQIVAGYTIPDPGMLLDKQPAEGGKSIFTLVRRHTCRVADHRHEQRFAAPEEAEIRLDGQPVPATVTNISGSGIMAVGELARDIGDTLEVRFSGHEPIWGTVIWKRGRQFGLSLPPESIGLDAA